MRPTSALWSNAIHDPIIARTRRALTSIAWLICALALIACGSDVRTPVATASVAAMAPTPEVAAPAGGAAAAPLGPSASGIAGRSAPRSASPGPMQRASGASEIAAAGAASQAPDAGPATPGPPACGDAPGPTVATDIHGTLTVEDYLNNIGDQTPRPGAADMLQEYSRRGYFILYVTGAPQTIIQETVRWFGENGFPLERAILTLPQTASLDATVNRDYKTARLREFVDQGYLIEYGYGDKGSDFQAYQAIGIANDHIFSIGDEAGTLGTSAIDETSSAAAAGYRDHIVNQVSRVPAVCSPSFAGKPIEVVD